MQKYKKISTFKPYNENFLLSLHQNDVNNLNKA